MEDRRDNRLINKVDEMLEKMGDMNVSIAKIQIDVAHHIKRTDLLEKQVGPMKEHASELKGAVKFLKLLAVIVAIVEACRSLHWIS